jgi:CRP-like cAMP-binding protein
MQVILRQRWAGHEWRNELLASLPEAALSLIASSMTETSFDRGFVLHHNGQSIGQVFFPQSGSASLMGNVPGGTSIEVASIGCEGAVGLNAALGSHVTSTLALVQDAGRFGHMSASQFAELAVLCRPILDMVMRYNDLFFAQIQQNAVCNAVHDAQARLCRWLVQARERTGGDTLPYTQEYLARALGLQRTTVTFICRILQSDGTLAVRRGRTQIKNPAALERRACACLGVTRRLIERFHAKPQQVPSGEGVSSFQPRAVDVLQ